jgi:hypothetical protein
MKFFDLVLFPILALLLTAEAAMAGQGTPSNPLPIIVEQRLNDSALSGPLTRLGTQVTQKKVNVLKAVYDFAILGGASGSSIILKDSDGGQATLPKGAVVRRVLISTPTALTASQTTATLSFGLDALATNFKAATVIGTYNAGERFVDGIPQGSAATAMHVNGYNQAVGMQIGVAPITAGKVVLYIEYYIGYPNEN